MKTQQEQTDQQQTNSQPGFNFKPEQLLQYQTCPDVNYQGGHLAGLGGCVYCAEIFRRHRLINGEKLQALQTSNLNSAAKYSSNNDAQEENQLASRKETQNFTSSANNDGDQDECGKLVCMKAGFCICD